MDYSTIILYSNDRGDEEGVDNSKMVSRGTSIEMVKSCTFSNAADGLKATVLLILLVSAYQPMVVWKG